MAQPIFFSCGDQCNEEKVTWDHSLVGFCPMGGQKARSQGLLVSAGAYWALVSQPVRWVSCARGEPEQPLAELQDGEMPEEKVECERASSGLVGESRTEKPLSSLILLHSPNSFSLRSRSSGLMDPPLYKDHIYENIIKSFFYKEALEQSPQEVKEEDTVWVGTDNRCSHIKRFGGCLGHHLPLLTWKCQEKSGLPKVTWVQRVTWLLFSRPGDLFLYPFWASFYISNGKWPSAPLQPLGLDSCALKGLSLFLSRHLPIDDPLSRVRPPGCRRAPIMGLGTCLCPARPAFSLLQHPPAPWGEKAIRKQLETQTEFFVRTKRHGELFEGKDFP